MHASSTDFRFLKRSLSIATILEHRGLLDSFRHSGTKLVGPCPIHHGKNPNAFVVHLHRNLWRCFSGCDAGGDIIEFVRRLDDLSYRQAALYLASMLSTAPHAPPQLPALKTSPTFRPFVRAIPLDSRCAWLQDKGIRPETARAFHAGTYSGNGWLKRCIAVRIFDLQGQPLGYMGRRRDPLELRRYGKWKFPKQLPAARLLFNFHRVQRRLQRGCVVVECPWAVMRLTQLEIPAVALLGTHLSSFQRQLLHETPRIVLMMDGDSAGRRATKGLTQRLAPHKLVRHFHLPQGLDPDDLSDHDLLAVRDLLGA